MIEKSCNHQQPLNFHDRQPAVIEMPMEECGEGLKGQANRKKWAMVLSVCSCFVCPLWCISLPSIVLACCFTDNCHGQNSSQAQFWDKEQFKNYNRSNYRLKISIWLSILAIILGSLVWCFSGVALILHFERKKEDRLLQQFGWLSPTPPIR